MDKKTRPIYMLPPRDPSQIERYTQTKIKEWKNIFHANGKEKKAGVAVLICNKIDFKTKIILRNKEGNYIMINGTIQQEDITLSKHLRTQHRSTKICKATLDGHKGRD